MYTSRKNRVQIYYINGIIQFYFCVVFNIKSVDFSCILSENHFYVVNACVAAKQDESKFLVFT